jgi:ABC-type uncharacterized transport system involved in gliding motility auxiliary subunit
MEPGLDALIAGVIAVPIILLLALAVSWLFERRR